MTEIRINSVLPVANVDSVKSYKSGSNFAFSFQSSVSEADLGSKVSVSRGSANQKSSSASQTAKAPERSGGNASRPSVKSSQNNAAFEKAQNAGSVSGGVNAVNADHSSAVQEASDSYGFEISFTGSADQAVSNVGDELSELQNQAVKTDETVIDEQPAAKQPMLNLDQIIGRLENSLVNKKANQDGNDSSETEDGKRITEVVAAADLEKVLVLDPDFPGFPKRAILHNNGETAPVIDLDRILAGLAENERPDFMRQEDDVFESVETAILIEGNDDGENTEIAADNGEETAVLPQIDLNKILESVNGVQDGVEVSPSADRINADQAVNGADRSEEADDDRIAANVGLVWNNLSDVVAAAWESFLNMDLKPSGVPLRNTVSIEFEPLSGEAQELPNVQGTAETDEGEYYTDYDALLFFRFAEAMSGEDKPTTLEELKAKLAHAMMTAIKEMNDPDKQQEELEEKILEFLLKFVEEMNKDEDEDDKETALDGNKSGDLGILLQIIENMIDEIRDVRENSTIANSEENVFEIAPTAAVDSVRNEYGFNIEINANKFTDTNKSINGAAAVENKTELGIPGAAEGLYTPVADVNANEAVGETRNADVSPIFENLTANVGPVGLTKVDENTTDDDLDAKAAKVLSKRDHDGTIKETELPDEFAELKKLIDDMKKTHDDEEEPEEEDDEEEKEVGVGGKGVKGDDKSNIIRAISIKSTESGDTAVAKAFSMERSGAKQILSQIASEVLNNMPKEKRTVALVMTLTPENLGKVTLKITEQAGKLNVVVTAHNKDTAEILASRMDGLQEALKDSGTQLEKYQVVYGPEQESDARQQNYDGSSKNPYVRDDDEEGSDKDGEFAELLQKAV